MINTRKVKKTTKAQEEIAGFGVILVLVGVIALLFIGLLASRNKTTENIEDYQITSFIQASLQVTTLCEKNGKNISVKDLINECVKEAECSNGEKSCLILNDTLTGILARSWEPVGENLSIQGYKLNITSNEEKVIFLKKGVLTSKETKGSSQVLPKDINFFFEVYYESS